jgi:anti-sigma regulatory factor (Ser/Thr protein kinase)
MPATDDVITLTLPREARFMHVPRLVVGGLAARLDLAYESLDDLQLAVETLFSADRYASSDELTIELTVLERGVEVLVGPLDAERLQADVVGPADEDTLGIGTLLSAVVDDVTVERRDGRGWARLTKHIPARAGG